MGEGSEITVLFALLSRCMGNYGDSGSSHVWILLSPFSTLRVAAVILVVSVLVGTGDLQELQ